MRSPSRPSRPPRDKRYGWFRKYRGYPYDPKWRTISRWTRVQPAVVIAIVDCILDAAAGGKPRGSISEFSHEECRSALELRTTGPVKKVVKALEKMGWIDREYLTKWDELQPDKEDQTAAERQQRRRAKIRQQNQADFPPSRVTVTTRPDQIKKEGPMPVESSQGSGKVGKLVTWGEAQEMQERPKQGSLPLFGVVARRGKR